MKPVGDLDVECDNGNNNGLSWIYNSCSGLTRSSYKQTTPMQHVGYTRQWVQLKIPKELYQMVQNRKNGLQNTDYPYPNYTSHLKK